MTSAVIAPDTKDTSTPSLTVAVNRLSISSSPFPSPGSPFFPPPILSPHEYAVMSSTAKRRSTDSRMNNNSESAPPSAHQCHPAGKPTTGESQDRAGDDKKDQGTTDHRGSDMAHSNGNADPLATVPPSSNGVVVDDVIPLTESPPMTPLASNQNTLTTIIQPSSPPSGSTCTDPAKSLSLDGLRSSRNSLTSSRPAPPSPIASRRTSAALSRCSSTRSRPNSTPAPAVDTAQSPTTPTPRQASSASVKIRDFAFPEDDPRHTGLGPLTPRPNRRLQRPVSAWSTSSATSSASSGAEDDNDPASSSAGGSSYGFAGWGLGRLSWFGVRGAAEGAGGAPSQNDFERNFEDAVSPSYEIDDPYDDDDDDFDDYEDSRVEGEDVVDRPLIPGLYRALYAFEPEGTAEMALEEDQIVRVVGRGGGVGWAIVARGEDEGHALVPEGYLELVSLDHEQEQLGEEDG